MKCIRNQMATLRMLLMIFCLSLLPASLFAEEGSETVYNGVVETQYVRGSHIYMYTYTTVEAKESIKALHETAEKSIVSHLFQDREKWECEDLKVFRDSMQAAFNSVEHVRAILHEKHLRILCLIDVKSDGTPYCSAMFMAHEQRMLDLFSSDELKQLLTYIHSYRFKPSNVEGNYYVSSIFLPIEFLQK